MISIMKMLVLFNRNLIIATVCIALPAAASGQTVTTLLSFDGIHGSGGASVVQGFDGNLYGTGAIGAYKKGNVFRISSSGHVTSLYSFCPQTPCTDGWAPSNLVLGSDGNFYGTTLYGGSFVQSECSFGNFGCGTVFKITPTGKLTTLHAFCEQAGCPDGTTPVTQSALVQGIDGNFYGTTSYGGSNGGGGTVFRITPAGELTTLYSFAYPNSSVGYDLQSGVAFGANGNLFGAANYGGTYQTGTLFELGPSEKLTVLYDFNLNPNLTNGPHVNGLTLASDGNLYGTYPGSGRVRGTILKVDKTGGYSVLYTLNYDLPFAPLVQGTDGNLYGSTSLGSVLGKGTLYQMTLNGTFSTLYNFCSQSGCPDGAQPTSALVQATNGLFYGTAWQGGTSTYCGHNIGCGTLFSLSMGLAPFVEAVPNFGKAGAIVNILGNSLTGTTSVRFDGVSAKFKVISSTLLKAQVPSGATTGTIEVTTPSGTLDSNIAFHVVQ